MIFFLFFFLGSIVYNERKKPLLMTPKKKLGAYLSGVLWRFLFGFGFWGELGVWISCLLWIWLFLFFCWGLGVFLVGSFFGGWSWIFLFFLCCLYFPGLDAIHWCAECLRALCFFSPNFIFCAIVSTFYRENKYQGSLLSCAYCVSFWLNCCILKSSLSRWN